MRATGNDKAPDLLSQIRGEVDGLVEVAGIEPASSGTVTGLLRAQLAVCFSAPPITQASR